MVTNRPMLAVLAAMAVLTGCASSTASATPEATASHEMSALPASASADADPSAADDPATACEGVEPVGEPIEIPLGTVSYAFDTDVIEGPTHCQPFVVVFTNSDPPSAPGGPAGTNQHNVVIRAESTLGPLLFEGEVIGQAMIRYEVPGLPSGTHYFYCQIHPEMAGDVVIGAGGG